MEIVITLGKLIGLLFLFCPPLLSNEFARPVMGTIFLVIFGVWITEDHCVLLVGGHMTYMYLKLSCISRYTFNAKAPALRNSFVLNNYSISCPTN